MTNHIGDINKMVGESEPAKPGSLERVVREVSDALDYARPLLVAISQDGGEPPWRQAKAERALAKVNAAILAMANLPNDQAEPLPPDSERGRH